MEEEPIKSDLNSAVCEMNLLNANSNTFSSTSSSVADESTSHYIRHRNVPTIPRPIFTLTTTKVQMNLNPRYISKVATKISNSPRKMYDTSLRMRPYFIPERSRTKSENAVEPSSSLPNRSDDIDAEPLSVAGEGTTHIGPTAATSAMDTSCDAAFEMNGNGVMVVPTLRGIFTKNGSKLSDGPRALTKFKSLDDLFSASTGRVRKADGSQPSHEMEFVSSRIQKLKVQD